jgi:hypothetical protein
MQLSEDPGPSTELVRTFSDQLALDAPNDSLVRGLATKVSHDREQEQRLITLQNEWQWLFRDARQLAQMYSPERRPTVKTCLPYSGRCRMKKCSC